jgi:aspartate/methionine/tyrosine aminotransferase
MHPLAVEYNTALAGTVVETFLSSLGKRLCFPRGIVAQAQEAALKKPRFNATAGLARSKNEAFMLPALRQRLPGLPPAAAVDYAPTGGDRDLRLMWRALQQRKNPSLAAVSATLPLVTAGITHALTLAADLFVDEGDNMILPEPAWDNYELVLAGKRGAAIARFPFFDDRSRFNSAALDRLLAAVQPGGKAALILNFPHNPTGYALSREEAAALADLLRTHARRGVSVMALVDDAYYGLCYRDDLEKESLFARLSDLHEKILAVKLDGATKEDFAWGFRVGFLTLGFRGLADTHRPALENKLLAAVRVSVSSASRPAQSLLLELLKNDDYNREKEAAFTVLQRRYQTTARIISAAASPHLVPLPFNSGYFLTFRTHGVDAYALREYLLHKNNTGVIALAPDLLRVTYAAVDEEDLPELFRLIYAAAETLCNSPQSHGDTQRSTEKEKK